MGINLDLTCLCTELIRLTHVLFCQQELSFFPLVKHLSGGLCPEEPVTRADLMVDSALSSALPIYIQCPLGIYVVYFVLVELQPEGLVCPEEPVAGPHRPWLTTSRHEWGIELASVLYLPDLTICVNVAVQLIV